MGCGRGAWLHAANRLGIKDLCGLDGVRLPQEKLLVSRNLITQVDLSLPFYIGREFELALCLEVAEHIPENCASSFISSIVAHTDTVLFSAACPEQPGQHHVNCQWPAYWQALFNRFDFVCADTVRWRIWDDPRVEPWYRQNMFWAQRDAARAGHEPKLKSVVHPDMASMIYESVVQKSIPDFKSKHMSEIELGSQRVDWYLTLPMRAALAKLGRRWTGSK